MADRKSYTIAWKNHCLELGKKTAVMGVVNITPDSFSDGGRYHGEVETAVSHGERLVAEGADIIDIGGESTRPFSDFVSEQEEAERVVPVIAALAERISVPISIDTTKAAVAEKAIAAGASIINDIGAMGLDPEMAAVAAENGVPVVVMHMLGTPKTMQVNPEYEDLFGEIGEFFEKTVDRAVQSGVRRSMLIIDPGIGFGKTVAHNCRLINEVHRLDTLDLPILVGSSRKAFIRKILNAGGEGDISPLLPEVETGTQATVSAAVLAGCHIVRVHNVANTVATTKVIDAIRGASEQGSLA